MKHYETMFILKPTLVEEELKSKIAFYQEVITNQGGVIANTLDMGARHLAYEIQKHKRGYYFVIYFQAEPAAVLELERLYRINEDVLRFIILKYENKKEQKAWHTLIDRASKKILHAAPEKPHKEAPAKETPTEGQEGQGV
ncbi:30S ribosomal protein S6 [Helicobacter heilmannii]|nr:30S ribosomal protein S6 [Helicobacter heilmannii]BDQ26371.1 30S ribosomal protein S6 [Helicobacter heilmannii]CCM11359.2 SSU ribosomal protein S6p [Helicobacter heilmannii ASB1.4]